MKKRQISPSELVPSKFAPLRRCSCVIAIPARNEADRVHRCLAALAIQRDQLGAPIPPGSFAVLLLVNNSIDATASAATRQAADLPYPLEIVEVSLTQSPSAGAARRRAMDEAAARLRNSLSNPVLMTTDADSVVTPSWYAANFAHLDAGADCVAGYIDAEPIEIVAHGPAFLARGRLEDTYLRLVAEIYALCDPRTHDPWPNHRVSSGASLAVKLAAYDAVGGMPNKALGEDTAFTALLDERGFYVRHPLDVSVVTSCRLEGRARGGAADTMRHRRDVPDAACDEDLEPAFATLRRAAYRGFLRKAFKQNTPERANRLLGGDSNALSSFASAWQKLETTHPALRRCEALRPSSLPREIAAARFILRHLRAIQQSPAVQGDKCLHAEPFVAANG